MHTLPEPLPQILKNVSRSFALSLGVLPGSLRAPLGLAYLLARAADTIADTRIVPASQRLWWLDRLREACDQCDATPLPELSSALTGPQRIPAERELLLRLPACVAELSNMPATDQEHVRRVLLLLIEGMQRDLRTFPSDDPAGLVALESREDLDRYTYYAAGCVGEFWTEMTMAHRPACCRWDREIMRRHGKRFGQALQMTNVLRDVAQDLRIGRCYIPRRDLTACGLTPVDLLTPQTLPRLRPVLDDLLRSTLDDYREAWTYTRAIPRTELRLRLACAWPMLIGLATLQRVREANALLDPATTVKIPRGAVYRILLRSGVSAWSDVGLDAHYRALRRPLESLAACGAAA